MSHDYTTELAYLRGLLDRALPHVEGGQRLCDLPTERATLAVEMAAAVGSKIVDNTDADVDDVGGVPV